MRKFIILFYLFLYGMDLQNNRKIETIKEKLPLWGKKKINSAWNLYIEYNSFFYSSSFEQNRRD